MNKKPDLLLLLIVLVIPGMLLSHVFLFKQNNETNPVSSDKAFSLFIEHQADEKLKKRFNPTALVRIDSLRPQTH